LFDDIVKEEASPTYNLVELVWRERLPLGMNLERRPLKVVDFLEVVRLALFAEAPTQTFLKEQELWR
jgi:hypothetical protein